MKVLLDLAAQPSLFGRILRNPFAPALSSGIPDLADYLHGDMCVSREMLQ